MNSDRFDFLSYDTGLAIQCVSRFSLAYLLTTWGGLVMTIANTGQSLDGLRVDDLQLRTWVAAGRSTRSVFMDHSKRDSSVVDAFTQVHISFKFHSFSRYTHA